MVPNPLPVTIAVLFYLSASWNLSFFSTGDCSMEYFFLFLLIVNHSDYYGCGGKFYRITSVFRLAFIIKSSANEWSYIANVNECTAYETILNYITMFRCYSQAVVSEFYFPINLNFCHDCISCILRYEGI